jgi:TPR repeat protein
MYLNGEGTPKNPQLAKKWFQQAADAGDVDAKEVLKSLE